jgi:hypothetical protein
VTRRDRVDVHRHYPPRFFAARVRERGLHGAAGRHLGEPDDEPLFAELNRRRALSVDAALHRAIDRENARALFSEETL